MAGETNVYAQTLSDERNSGNRLIKKKRNKEKNQWYTAGVMYARAHALAAARLTGFSSVVHSSRAHTVI